MTEADLAAIDARLEAATPGPWRRAPHCVWAGDREPGPFGGPGFVCSTHHDVTIRERESADADLIAHAPDDLRRLRGEVDRLRAEGEERVEGTRESVLATANRQLADARAEVDRLRGMLRTLSDYVDTGELDIDHPWEVVEPILAALGRGATP